MSIYIAGGIGLGSGHVHSLLPQGPRRESRQPQVKVQTYVANSIEQLYIQDV